MKKSIFKGILVVLLIFVLGLGFQGCKNKVENIQKKQVKKIEKKENITQPIEKKEVAKKHKIKKIKLSSKLIDDKIKKHIDWKNKDEIKFLKKYLKTNEMTDKRFYDEYEIKPDFFDDKDEYDKKKVNALVVDGIIKYKTEIMKKKYEDYINSEQYKKDFKKCAAKFIKDPPLSKNELRDMYGIENYDSLNTENKIILMESLLSDNI
ncbi:hypothetical protein J7L48_04955, partial [bacterium]|nr:hypothetical protein [bacterium]